MANIEQFGFSEYEVRSVGFKFAGGSSYSSAACIGSCEETMNTRVTTKKCRGIVKKKKVKGTGDGTVKLSLHIPYEIYYQAYGMNNGLLDGGVRAYGSESVHEEFCMVMKVLDEDDKVKYKAYPRCVLETGINRKIENGAEEVAEVELEISVMPDEYGYGMYEAIEEDMDKDIAETWMSSFTPALVIKQA